LPKKISFESRNLFGAKYGTNFNELEGNSWFLPSVLPGLAAQAKREMGEGVGGREFEMGAHLPAWGRGGVKQYSGRAAGQIDNCHSFENKREARQSCFVEVCRSPMRFAFGPSGALNLTIVSKCKFSPKYF
jgi:hypothetical protein